MHPRITCKLMNRGDTGKADGQTFSAIDSMQRDRLVFRFKLSFMKYDTSDDVRPAAVRMLSISCIVKMKMICPEERYLISLDRRGMY